MIVVLSNLFFSRIFFSLTRPLDQESPLLMGEIGVTVVRTARSRRRPGGGVMLDKRRRLWPSFTPPSESCFIFVGT